MLKTVQKYINNLTNQPQSVFLIDALGALLTTISIYLILPQFKNFIGIPIITLDTLALIALLLFSYSTLCYFFIKYNWRPFLGGIILFNSLYSIVSLYLLINTTTIKPLGWLYFIIELIVIALLIVIELKTFFKQATNHKQEI